MSIKQILSLVQFARGTSLVWDALATPIPNGVVAFSIDDGVFKLGDGVSSYSVLPTLFSFSDLVSAQGGVSGLFNEPTVADNGKIVVVAFDAGTGTMKYSVSNTTLADLLSQISALEAGNTNQDVAVAQLLSLALSIDVSINTGNDNEVIVLSNGRYTSSGLTVSNIQSQVAAGVTYVPGSHLEEPVFYTTVTKEKKVDKLELLDGNTYYLDVVGFNSIGLDSVFSVTSPNTNVVITLVSGSLFSVRFNGVTGTTKTDTPVIVTVAINTPAGTSEMKKAIACLVLRNRILVALYGGAGTDISYEVVVDSNDNIFVVGNTNSEGLGNTDGLIIKYDKNLNILAKKLYSGVNAEGFSSAALDDQGNLYVGGQSASEGPASDEMYIIKFDNNLNKLAGNRYGGTGAETFYGIIVDKQGYIIAAGTTSSEGLGYYDAIIYKFDQNLNIIARKRYGGASGSEVFRAIAKDNLNNFYCAGFASSEGSGSDDALIVKFDSNLNILAKKRYGGSASDAFYGVTVDTDGNVYCVGGTASEGGDVSNALIVKFDNNLNKLAGKHFGGSLEDKLYRVVINRQGNIVTSGWTKSEGSGNYDGIVYQFDTNLNIVGRKRYGGSGDDQLYGIVVDSFGNIITCGYTSSVGAGLPDVIIMKIPPTIPAGTLSGIILSSMTLSDSALTINDSSLTLADSALTLADSTLAGAASILTVRTSYLTQVSDTLN